VYAGRPDVRAVVHAHPVALVAFSVVHQVPDTRVFHQAWTICGAGGFAPYRPPGSAELGEAVAGVVRAGHECVILENHGVLTTGRDLAEAFRRFETFEFAGRTIVKASQLGRPINALSDDDLEVVREAKQVAGDVERGELTGRERELRAGLADFVHRGYEQRLFISTHGTFSARIDETSFVITPHDVDRATLEADDLVLVSGGSAERGRRPSHAARLHHIIYRRHPEVGAIVNAAPVYTTAFGATGSVPDTRTIPESRVVLRELRLAPFRLQFADPESLAGLVSMHRPAVLLENDGVLVTGTDVLDAFDRLEVLESTAEAIVNALPLGPLAPMSDAAVSELEATYFG
jgi:L-fuculose-phosphate aldolase